MFEIKELLNVNNITIIIIKIILLFGECVGYQI